MQILQMERALAQAQRRELAAEAVVQILKRRRKQLQGHVAACRFFRWSERWPKLRGANSRPRPRGADPQTAAQAVAGPCGCVQILQMERALAQAQRRELAAEAVVQILKRRRKQLQGHVKQLDHYVKDIAGTGSAGLDGSSLSSVVPVVSALVLSVSGEELDHRAADRLLSPREREREREVFGAP